MSDPEITIAVMSDGSIRTDGPEPKASQMRMCMEQYFAAMGIAGAEARASELRRLTFGLAGAREETVQ